MVNLRRWVNLQFDLSLLKIPLLNTRKLLMDSLVVRIAWVCDSKQLGVSI